MTRSWSILLFLALSSVPPAWGGYYPDEVAGETEDLCLGADAKLDWASLATGPPHHNELPSVVCSFLKGAYVGDVSLLAKAGAALENAMKQRQTIALQKATAAGASLPDVTVKRAAIVGGTTMALVPTELMYHAASGQAAPAHHQGTSMVARHGIFVDRHAFKAFKRGNDHPHSDGLTAKLIGYKAENAKGLPTHFPMFERYPLWDSEFTGLHLAAANGQLAAATWLLANGADPNQASSHGVLPLACALASRSTAIVQALLAAGATVPTKGTKMLHAEESNQRYETATVIQWSLSRGRTRELKLLLNAAGAAAWSKDALIGPAVRSGHCESVAAALSAGVARGDEIVATEEKDEATMKMKPHHRKRRGRFPSEAPALTVASALGLDKCVAALLDWAAKQHATGKSRTSIVNRVAKVRTSADAKRPGTALTAAIANGRLGVARLLLEGGADVSRPDGTGWTPLHYAAKSSSWSGVKLLLGHGAVADVKTPSRFWFWGSQRPLDVLGDGPEAKQAGQSLLRASQSDEL